MPEQLSNVDWNTVVTVLGALAAWFGIDRGVKKLGASAAQARELGRIAGEGIVKLAEKAQNLGITIDLAKLEGWIVPKVVDLLEYRGLRLDDATVAEATREAKVVLGQWAIAYELDKFKRVVDELDIEQVIAAAKKRGAEKAFRKP